MSRGFVALIVLVAAFFGHLRAKDGEFLFYDDQRYVVRNRDIESLEDPLRFFLDLSTGAAADAPTRDVYRPVRSLSYAVLVQLFGKDSAAPFHALAILLHAGCSVLLLLLLYRSGLEGWPAAAGALVFALHPVTVEVTAWVCSLGDAWCGLFVLLSMLAWSRDRPGLALLALVPALFSKEHAVVVPGLWLAWDWSLRRDPVRLKKAAAWAGGGLALVVGFLLFRHFEVGAKMTQLDGRYPLGTVLAGLGWYAAGLLFPFGSTFDTRVPETALASPQVLIGVGVLAALAYGVVRGAPRVRLGALWFLIALVPVCNVFVTLKIPTADRFLYLPLMGLAFLVGEIALRTRPWSLRVGWAALLLLFLLTVSRIGDWRDDASLIRAGLRVDPKSKMLLWAEAALHARRARDLVLAGDYRAAEMEAQKAVPLYGNYLKNTQPVEQTRALVELGDLLYRIGEGRKHFAPEQYRDAWARAMQAYVQARALQVQGTGQTTEEEIEQVNRRVVELAVEFAEVGNKNLPQTIAIGVQSIELLEQRYGADMTAERVQLRLVDSARARVKHPAEARQGFNWVLEKLDELERQGHAVDYLRGQAYLYRSTLTDLGERSVHDAERAYQVFLAAARKQRAVRLRALIGAARAACLVAKLGGGADGSEAWKKKGLALLKQIPEVARRDRLMLTPALVREITALESGCGR